jgi:hypothetical protein
MFAAGIETTAFLSSFWNPAARRLALLCASNMCNPLPGGACRHSLRVVHPQARLHLVARRGQPWDPPLSRCASSPEQQHSRTHDVHSCTLPAFCADIVFAVGIETTALLSSLWNPAARRLSPYGVLLTCAIRPWWCMQAAQRHCMTRTNAKLRVPVLFFYCMHVLLAECVSSSWSKVQRRAPPLATPRGHKMLEGG